MSCKETSNAPDWGNTGAGRTAEILLVEDSPEDAMLTREGFREGQFKANLHHVENGMDALSFLRKEGNYREAPTPDLVLLDLNMPVMDGREVLAELIADESLRHLPVVVLTTSVDEQEVLNLYRKRISSYIRKPLDFNDFIRVVRGIKDYWFEIVILPRGVA